MTTYALHSVLRPGREADYDRVHAEVPAELLAALQEAGITEWRIWRSGSHLFHLVDSDDLAAALRRLDEDPRNHRWQAFISDYVDHFEEPGRSDLRTSLPQVWTLGGQRET